MKRTEAPGMADVKIGLRNGSCSLTRISYCRKCSECSIRWQLSSLLLETVDYIHLLKGEFTSRADLLCVPYSGGHSLMARSTYHSPLCSWSLELYSFGASLVSNWDILGWGWFLTPSTQVLSIIHWLRFYPNYLCLAGINKYCSIFDLILPKGAGNVFPNKQYK